MLLFMLNIVMMLASFVNVNCNNIKDCIKAFQGSTVQNGYEEYLIDLTFISSNESQYDFIRFDTCSNLTTFDTIIYLLNANQTSIIDYCDDWCSVSSVKSLPCIQSNRLTHSTVWDLYLQNLSEINYILQINGYQNQTGSYQLFVSYNCDDEIFISKATTLTTNYPTTSPTIPIWPFMENATFTLTIDSTEQENNNEFVNSEQVNYLAAIIVLSILLCCLCIICCAMCYEKKSVFGPIVIATASEAAQNCAWGLKIISQLLVSGCSIVGSLALSRSLGLSDKDNGILAVTMGITTLILASLKAICNFGYAEKKEKQTEKRLARILGITICLATITDATFDIFQGIAAITGQEYSDLSAALLVFATWMGVGEEIMEAALEISTSICVDLMDQLSDTHSCISIIVNIIMVVATMVELSLGIYLLTTFENTSALFIDIGIVIQSVFLVCSCIWVIVIIYELIQEDQGYTGIFGD